MCRYGRALAQPGRAPLRVSVTVGELLISASASSGGREALSVRRLGTIGIAGAAHLPKTPSRNVCCGPRPVAERRHPTPPGGVDRYDRTKPCGLGWE